MRMSGAYRIGTVEVTNAQYAEFLNAKAFASRPSLTRARRVIEARTNDLMDIVSRSSPGATAR
jgi:formylglycine-generating enzyme required for sulfatase activity